LQEHKPGPNNEEENRYFIVNSSISGHNLPDKAYSSVMRLVRLLLHSKLQHNFTINDTLDAYPAKTSCPRNFKIRFYMLHNSLYLAKVSRVVLAAKPCQKLLQLLFYYTRIAADIHCHVTLLTLFSVLFIKLNACT